MRTLMMVATIVGIAAIALTPAFAQADGVPDQAGGPPNEDGLHGQLGPRANGPGDGQRGMRGGARGQMGRGYIEVNETTEALWKQIGELKSQQHEAQWELFVALSQEGATKEIVAPQIEKLRGLAEQMKALNEQLEPYRKQMMRPEGAGRGGQGAAGHRGRRNRDNPDNPDNPDAAPQGEAL